MRKILQTATVLAVCLVTWVTSNTILAQQRRKLTPTQPKDGLVSSSKSRQKDDLSLPKAHTNAADEPPVASRTLNKFSVTVVEGKAAITAGALMADRRPGMSYIWRLKVIDSASKPQSDLWYDQQIFQMEADGTRSPTFNDVIDLPKGQSLVQLSLYELRNDTDPSSYKNEEISNGFLVLRGVQKVTK